MSTKKILERLRLLEEKFGVERQEKENAQRRAEQAEKEKQELEQEKQQIEQ
jgi:flagellar motor protein MotB